MITGGQKGIADIPMFAGIGLLGGALLREKIVAAASRRLAIIVDDSKLVDRLGLPAAGVRRSSGRP